jgi:hypothetical protein
VLDTTAARLRKRGHHASGRFYIYRTAQSSGAGQGGQTRPRTILAFANPDTALGFAQRSRLGHAPRLWRISLAQLCAIMIQRPVIGTLLFADEPIEIIAEDYLPVGLRLERTVLLMMLKGEETHGKPL